MSYKFIYTDISEENEYKIYFNIVTKESLNETVQEIDGEIYIEDDEGNEVNFKNLTKLDKEYIMEQIDEWIERDNIENYNDYSDEMSEYYNKGI